MKRLAHIFENFSTSRREKRWIQKHEEYQLYFLLEKGTSMHLYKGIVPPDRLLKKRFQNLLVHEICHNESNHPPEIVLQILKKAINTGTLSSGEQRDIFGMTPLHIYALSSSQDSRIYELLLDSYPESVVTKDMYGKIPLFYALWGNKPSSAVELLVKKQRTLFPQYSIHWASMIETMVGTCFVAGRANETLRSIIYMIHTRQTAYNQSMYWRGILTKWALQYRKVLEENKGAYVDIIKHVMTYSIMSRSWPRYKESWKQELVLDIDDMNISIHHQIANDIWNFYSKLDHYEILSRYKEPTHLLELAVWKSSIDSSHLALNDDSAKDRANSRVECGSDIIIANVIPFLFSGKKVARWKVPE